MFQEVLDKNNNQPDEITNKDATADKTQTPVSGDGADCKEKAPENPEVDQKKAKGRPKRDCSKKDDKSKVTAAPKKAIKGKADKVEKTEAQNEKSAS